MSRRSKNFQPLEWALRYSGIGWYVLPVGDDKKPLGGFGLASASIEEGVIRGWWKQFPQAQVAIACKPSGLVVIDQDRGHKPGVDGVQSLLTVAHGRSLNDELISSTPKGGQHAFYAAPSGDRVRSRTGVFAGVDVKAGGGQFGGYVLVPCGAEGRAWTKGDPFAGQAPAIPEWLLDQLCETQIVVGPAIHPSRKPDATEDLLCYVASLLFSIPASVGRTEWLQCIHAAHAALGGSYLGEELVESWSELTSAGDQYKPGEATQIYRKARLPSDLSGRRPVTERTLLSLARKCQMQRVFGDLALGASPVEFPVNSFPRFFRSMVEEGANAQGVDVAFWGVPLLGILAGCIGATRVVQLKVGWAEPCVLWTATVGHSGSGKSPPLRALKAPVVAHDAELHRKTRALQALFAAELEESRRSRAGKDDKAKSRKRATAPPVLAAVVDDVTLEGLLARLADNPRGLLLINDELASWLRGFNRYRKSGGDEQAWLSIHNADSAKVDRKGGSGGPQQIFIPRAAVSVVGTIQPSVAREWIGNSESIGSGLAARILLAQPPTTAAKWTDAQPSAATASAYEAAVRGLLALELDKGAPVALPLSDQARVMFVAYHDELGRAGDAAARAGKEHFAAVLSKLRGAVPRIALVLALAQAAEEGAADRLEEVGAEAMAGGIAFARYFEREARYLYASWANSSADGVETSVTPGGRIAARVLDALRRGEQSRTDLLNALGRNVKSEDLDGVLGNLQEDGVIERHKQKAEGPGRPPEIWRLCDGGMDA